MMNNSINGKKMDKYNTLANKKIIEETAKALESNGVEAVIVEDGKDALEKIKQFIPSGASIMNGSSKTLEQIGYVDYLKQGSHGWNNLHEKILAETDKEKQKVLRKQAVLFDYYLGSVHALCKTGEFIVASNSGSQLPHIVFTSQNLIFVVGAQKIVSDLIEAFRRLEEYVVPLENEHMKALYGRGTMISKIVIFKKENPMMQRKVRMIIINENLGF